MNIVKTIAIKLRGGNSLLYKLRKSKLFIDFVLPLFNFNIPINLHLVNHKVYVNLAKHQSWLLTSGVLTPELSSLFLAIDKVFYPKIFYDIGANIGFYSWLLLTRNKDIKTVLFEPDIDNLNLLKKTIKKGKRKELL